MSNSSTTGRRPSVNGVYLLLVLIALATVSCSSSSKWVTLRNTPRSPLNVALGLFTRQGPKPTERTRQLLRRYDLESLQTDDRALLARLNEIDQAEPNREHVYAIAELAYVGAKRAERSGDTARAMELYNQSLLNSYRYIFATKGNIRSNPYDPQFRRACDLYNGGLEGTLRLLNAERSVRPGQTHVIRTPNFDCQLNVVLKSDGWHPEDFDRIEFVSDYEVHGLTNHHHFYGLGVPLVVVRRHHDDDDPREQFYPPDLSFPVTALLRITGDKGRPNSLNAAPVQQASASGVSERRTLHAVLELHDPLEVSSVALAGVDVPLEADLSTPLAHYLSQPALDDNRVSKLGLLKPDELKQLTGLYMLEPYREGKIPVVMVHGLWSSPVTWMEMFNDLRSDPWIRDNYQFWFYLYPSGQPFWSSAAQMRTDLAHMRRALDPERRQPALDQTVLVGHSMGGLVSRLQTVDSGDEFWQALSEKPFRELEADEEIRERLAQTFFFDPNPSVRRVVTIGTPHRGSEFANNFTRWLGSKIIRIPNMIMHGRNQIARNSEYFRSDAPLRIDTSIDSLAPDSPLLPVLLTADTGPWVTYHNIIGKAPNKGLQGAVSRALVGDGDGVVALASARLEQAASEIVVPAAHVQVHRHPQSILEVRRILYEHVAKLRTFPYVDGGVQLAENREQIELPTVDARFADQSEVTTEEAALSLQTAIEQLRSQRQSAAAAEVEAIAR